MELSIELREHLRGISDVECLYTFKRMLATIQEMTKYAFGVKERQHRNFYVNGAGS